ncbi:MAG: FAD-dependent oxidoreductase, partial [Reinekea sp.]|nr:FAD-dependent oxidoreductase [Reinekea sp.]
MEQQSGVFDIAIIGGGINGCGIAADAAGRGLKVYLCEQADFASGTSSASSKLIHGGLRYLEHYEFRLVKEALAEREVLLNSAPHLVSPLKFTMPHQSHLRPSWMIRCGLFLYDHLSRVNSLPRARMQRLNKDADLREDFNKIYEYYDCWVDDSRLVIANAMLARQHGAVLETRTTCQKISYSPNEKLWQLISFNKTDGSTRVVQARNIV